MPTTGGTGGSTGPSGTGFGYWDPGGCNCPIGPIQVEGCGNLALGSGMAVSIYTASGGTLLFSGTTDAAGKVYPAGVVPGTWYVTVSGQPTRFAAYGANTALGNAALNAVALAPAAGYTCLGLGCVTPTTTTLQYTGPQGAHSLAQTAPFRWKSSDGVVELDTTGTSATISYNGGTTTTSLSSHACPTATSLSFFDGSTVTE